MTRSLQWAGVGLCAFLMPACKGAGDPPETAYSNASSALVVVNRPPGAAPAGSREQIAQGLGNSGPNDVALATTPGAAGVADLPAGMPAELPAPAAPAVANQVAIPPIVAPPAVSNQVANPPIVAPAVSNQVANPPIVAPSAAMNQVANPPIVAPSVPEAQLAAEIKQASTPLIAAPLPEEPIRYPDWPQLGAPAAISSGTQRPDYLPPADPAPAPQPSPQIIQFALPKDAAAVPAQPVPTSTSLKVAEPLTSSQAPPTHNETILMQALSAFQNNRPAEAAEILKHLGATNQEVLMCLMPLLVRLGEGNVNDLPPDELALSIDRLQTAASLLKSKAALRVDRACFCRAVRKFGDIDPYEPRHEFHTGDLVILYAELKNFTCNPVAAQGPYNANQRGFNIHLSATLELRDARNGLVWRTDLNKSDYTQTPPQDYWHTYRFCVPEKIPAGVYTLWLNIVDKPTGRTVRKPLELRVVQS